MAGFYTSSGERHNLLSRRQVRKNESVAPKNQETKENSHKRSGQNKNGVILALEKSHGEIVYLMTKFFCLAIAEAPTWDSYINMNEQLLDEINVWENNLSKLNGRDLFPSTAVSEILYSDASGTGAATVLTAHPNRQKYIVNRMFSKEEINTSSTERELLGVLHGLIEFKHLLRGQSILWYTGSKKCRQNCSTRVHEGLPSEHRGCHLSHFEKIQHEHKLGLDSKDRKRRSRFLVQGEGF